MSEKRFRKFPNMDDKEFWTEPSRKLPIIDGQKPDRAFHAVKYVATVLGWRGDTAQKLRDELKEQEAEKEQLLTKISKQKVDEIAPEIPRYSVYWINGYTTAIEKFLRALGAESHHKIR
jgi:SpoVK/Ycf46/Vps4 family AAA+-type ATPase